MRSNLMASIMIALSSVFLLSCGKNEEIQKMGITGKQIVCFMPTTTNTYIAEWARGAEEEAERLGYELIKLENGFKQEEQDIQVQQRIAAKVKPACYIWWPTDNAGGLASLKALADTGVPGHKEGAYMAGC